MKFERSYRSVRIVGVLSALLMVQCFVSLHAEISIDGQATVEDGYATISTQTQVSGNGSGNLLASLRQVQTANKLNLMITGRATNHAIILFIDAKPGGVNRIRPNQIRTYPGGEQDFINRLANSEEEGMTFENGFQPEIAIRIYGDEVGGVKHAYVNRFDLVAGTQVYVGDAHASVISDGVISAIRAEWQSVVTENLDAYESHSKGVEMALNLSSLGVIGSIGSDQVVKVSAILVSKIEYDPINGDSFEGTNQVLAPLVTESIGGLSGEVGSFDFQDEPGAQTVSITVSGFNPIEDTDGDGLLNGVETATGIFVDASNTGTNPESADSDGDGYPDGAEVNGTSELGYVSDPNLRNEARMSVVGSFFNNWAVNQPATEMTQESQSLAGQYRWHLNYKFSASQIGNFTYKFTANGDRWWGLSSQSGIVLSPGNDIPQTIVATGIHRFDVDLRTLAHAFERMTFANKEDFLSAYGLTADGDADGDGVTNGNEFAANTDPTNADTDGDGVIDSSDTSPLGASDFENWAKGLPDGQRGKADDVDGDGFSNLQEFLFGTPASQPTGALCLLRQTTGGLTMTWLQRSVSSSYELLKSASLETDTWIASGASVVPDPDQSGVPDGYIRVSASLPMTQSRMFFRVAGHE